MKIKRSFFYLALFFVTNTLFAQGNSASKVIASNFTSFTEKDLSWPAITLVSPNQVKLEGPLGQAFQKGLQRMRLAPYTTDWLLSDVSFKVNRIFTNYSGDVSGRFLELTALVSKPDQLWPSTLPEVLKSIVKYQKPDGHFGTLVDWSKPLIRGDSAITLLWGNARLLVGLITAANKLHNTTLLAAAKRLGDFYVNTADELCSSARLKEYKASGTGGDSYTCCYFPAIEGLVMLYQATHDERYLHQAERMAKFFLHFDALPVNHSHGNLSAWRGITDLYQVTHKSAYLDEAIAKWNKAVGGGYVWPLGGIGEHWYINFNGDEGCSEADWLRFNLILWRCTGDNRYLDMAGRLLQNQYLANQTPDGGYGMRYYDGDASGPVGAYGAVSEWDFCCNFAGPLGLYFLKSYLVTSSPHYIFINFPYTFTATVKVNKTNWLVSVKTGHDLDRNGEKQMTIKVKPEKTGSIEPVKVLLRIPSWATVKSVNEKNDNFGLGKEEYLILSVNCKKEARFVVTLKATLQIEGRRFTAESVDKNQIDHFKNVSLIWGSKLLYQLPAGKSSTTTLLATATKDGRVGLLQNPDGSFASVELREKNISKRQILAAIDSGKKVLLMPGPVHTTDRTAFVYDLTVIPEEFISKKMFASFAKRKTISLMPHYGSNLQNDKALWPAYLHWNFTPKGILIAGGARGGGIGLIEGRGYKDYRFSFDMTLPEAGKGISGWVVRAKDDYNYILFQLQSKDTKYHDPRYKTKPNTLRPIICKNGKLTVLDPVPLKGTILTGRSYHVATECKDNRIMVFINGKKVYQQHDEGFDRGKAGFRVNAPLDQGLFNHISLLKL